MVVETRFSPTVVDCTVLRDSNAQPTSRFEELTLSVTPEQKAEENLEKISSKRSLATSPSVASSPSAQLLEGSRVAREDYSFVLAFPTEVHLHLLKFLPRKDLISVSLTSKFFREASSTLLYGNLEIDLDSRVRLELLRARVDDNSVAPAVRSLRLKSRIRHPGMGIYRNLPGANPLDHHFVHAISKTQALREVTLPYWLFTDECLSTAWSHPRIQLVRLEGPAFNSTLHFDTPSLPPSPSSPRSLTFALELGTEADFHYPSKIISYLQWFGKIVEVTLDVQDALTDASPLDPATLPFLRTLRLELCWIQVASLLPSYRSASKKLPSLKTIYTKIYFAMDFHGFKLSKHNWINGSAETLFKDWKKVELDEIEYEQDAQTGELSHLTLQILEDCIIDRSMILSLAEAAKSVTHLSIRNGSDQGQPSWPDWDETVSAFAGFTSLRHLEFGISVTENPTYLLSVGCTPECLKLSYKKGGSLELDLALLGGLDGLWDVQERINLRRLELLAPHLPVSTTVVWEAREGEEGERRVVTRFVGRIEARADGKNSLTFFREIERLRTKCYGCLREEDEPKELIGSLAYCGRQEVRSALVEIGFDLDAFDSAYTGDERGALDHFLRGCICDNLSGSEEDDDDDSDDSEQ